MHLHVFKVVSWLATLAWTRHCEGKLHEDPQDLEIGEVGHLK